MRFAQRKACTGGASGFEHQANIFQMLRQPRLGIEMIGHHSLPLLVHDAGIGGTGSQNLQRALGIEPQRSGERQSLCQNRAIQSEN